MTKIELTTGSKTIIYKMVNNSHTCPESYRVTYQSYRYTEDWELAEIRRWKAQLDDDVHCTELILDDDKALNLIINADDWSA